ncbi:hypothetical protein J5N97_023847 [Dioscorea zingiberensis]|uniref:LysM domain-containing protein n=1 Tax=Dioscorea zingiberensis TaxID=325984 RepID=A0A9D5H898_9LILI|nr:hypothetical protein J5N97_023847 [Dioscorea zingiberensis]
MQAESGSGGGVNSNGVSESNGFDSISVLSTSSSSPVSGVNFIEHRVSKMDTLAGVAIKYGVEVADIKRMNGLVTDLQMYALKTLQIPLPGRHPPSPIVMDDSASNGVQTPHQHNMDILDSFQSLKLKPPSHRKVSAAMSTLQGYYNLTPSRKGQHAEGTEMAVYKTGRALFLEDDPLPKESPASDPLMNHHRKTRSIGNGFSPENGKTTKDAMVISVGESGESERANSEKSVRRRQKTDADPFSWMPRMLFKDSSVGLSGKQGKGAALKPKTGSQTDNDISRPNSISAGDSSMANALLAVRKSSSTSSLQDSENGSSVWSPWNLKSDVISRPIFDGLPNPMNIWRNKTAMD